MDDPFNIANLVFHSRLFLGSSSYPNLDILMRCLETSGAEVVTVAIRRAKLDSPEGESLISLLKKMKVTILPNTAGCYTVKEAVLTAQLAREALETNLVKLEVIGDEETLFPDVEHLQSAAKTLIRDGFTVLPYCNDDPITCKKLEDLGCAAVMPLAAPIGSGMGIRNPYNLQIIRSQVKVPVIVDAGVGTASDVAIAMELGCDGVLLNTAVAKARQPVFMAEAMRKAVEAGRLAYQAGRIPRKMFAEASTTDQGRISF